VCHQTVSLVARQLEEAGIPTVVMGAAKDIVETVGVPRFVFSDVPLGNSAGLPHDEESQRTVLELALTTLEVAPGPRTTVQSPIRWPGDPHAWKRDHMNLSGMDEETAAKAREAFQEQKRRAGLSSP
jgi:D-proline reductase (dithiol) PrdB